MRHNHRAQLLTSFTARTHPSGAPLQRGRAVVVAQWETGLLFRHGRLDTVLEPGAHRRWGGGYSLRTVDVRPWLVFVPTQEIPTADGVTVKVTVAGLARVADAVAFVVAAREAEQSLYLAVQVALRELVATTSVDDLLAGRGELGARLLAGLRGIDELGITVEQLELRDIVLPAELRKAQAAVLIARAQAQAALERARGETAALRNLANAARLVADSPALLPLRLLQQLDGSSGHTVVLGTAATGTGGAAT